MTISFHSLPLTRTVHCALLCTTSYLLCLNCAQLTRNAILSLTSMPTVMSSHVMSYVFLSDTQGDRYCDRVALQDEHYVEIRDSLRNARKKKDGKVDQVMPAAKTTALPRYVPFAKSYIFGLYCLYEYRICCGSVSSAIETSTRTCFVDLIVLVVPLLRFPQQAHLSAPLWQHRSGQRRQSHARQD